MKVLHLTTHLNTGGITVYVFKLSQGLRKYGVETQFLSSGGTALNEFEKEGFKTWVFPIRTKSELNPKIYWNLPGIIRMIQGEKIDLLHAHTRVTEVLASWIHVLTGIPYVTTCHGFYKPRLGRRLHPAWGNRVIAISDPVRVMLRETFHVEESKIRLVENGVDVEELDERMGEKDASELKRSYGFEPTDTVIGVVSRIVEDKGHSYLIRAVKDLRRKFQNLKLLIAGEGTYRQALENLVRDLRLEEHVVFLGNLSDVTEVYAAIDLFAFTPTYREGFGLTIAEAMACRKPVVLTAIPALDKIVENEKTGLLVPPKDEDALEKALARVILDEGGIRRKLIGEARKLVTERFTLTRVAGEIFGVYQEVVG
ncbi:MAG: glycosyltransferase family 4 protein [Candidatus Omnitrophica bacterium]|nr:glycosyltransferase family 4 protein [Candidatus Omnitrophota bacterium]